METKKYGPNERTEQNSGKTPKQNGDKQPIRCRVQNSGYKVLRELSEYFTSMQKTQAEMKGILLGMSNL